MKVFIVSRGLPTENYKMNGIFEWDQAKALARAGVDVVFLAVDMRSIRRKRKFGQAYREIDGVKVYSIDWPIGNIPRNIFYKFNYKALEKVYKKAVKKEGKPDIVHAYFTHQAYISALLAEKYDFKLVVTEANSHINTEDITPSLYRAAEFAYEKADKLLTPSPDFRRKLFKKFGVDSAVVTVLPDMKIFHYSDRKPEGEFRFASTGRLDSRKGMKELIDGFYAAFKNSPEVVLNIFGDGPEMENLQAQINELDMGQQIFLRGMVSRKVIAEKYAQSHVFALYSHTETFGLVYLEALAAGLPIIVSTCGGPEHLVREDNGILVKLFEKEELVQALNHMREHYQDYDPVAISKAVKNDYSPENITKKLIKVYEEIL